MDLLLILNGIGSAGEEDRQEIEAWLSSQGNLSEFKVDCLVDSNYGI